MWYWLKALKKDIKDQHHKHQQKNGPLQASFTSRFGALVAQLKDFLHLNTISSLILLVDLHAVTVDVNGVTRSSMFFDLLSPLFTTSNPIATRCGTRLPAIPGPQVIPRFSQVPRAHWHSTADQTPGDGTLCARRCSWALEMAQKKSSKMGRIRTTGEDRCNPNGWLMDAYSPKW